MFRLYANARNLSNALSPCCDDRKKGLRPLVRQKRAACLLMIVSAVSITASDKCSLKVANDIFKFRQQHLQEREPRLFQNEKSRK